MSSRSVLEERGSTDAIVAAGEARVLKDTTAPIGMLGVWKTKLPSPDKPIAAYTSKEVGAMGEDMATSFLEEAGYEILARNWRCRGGEIDIIARGDDPTEVIPVEVKTRVVMGRDADLMPELSVDRRKQAKYTYMAQFYLSVHPEFTSVRFDVIAINLAGYRRGKLRHLMGAYSWDENK